DRALVYAAHLPAAGTRPRRARRRDPRLAGERRLTVLWVGSGANGAGSDPQNGNGTERSCPSMGWVTGESLTSASHPVSAVVRLRLLLSGVSRSSCVRWAYGRTVREPESRGGEDDQEEPGRRPPVGRQPRPHVAQLPDRGL